MIAIIKIYQIKSLLRRVIDSLIPCCPCEIICYRLKKPWTKFLYTQHLTSMPDPTILLHNLSESSYRGSNSPTIMRVFGHFLGKNKSPFAPPTYYYVNSSGDARGLYWFCWLSYPRYSLKHNARRLGCSIGVQKEFILEGEKVCLRSQAG